MGIKQLRRKIFHDGLSYVVQFGDFIIQLKTTLRQST